MKTIPKTAGFMRVCVGILIASGFSATALAQQPTAFSYALRTPASTQANIAYSAVIIAGDGQNAVTVVNQPAHGSVAYPQLLDGTAQAFAYTPTGGYTGLDEFYFSVMDGSGDVSFGVISINVGNVTATAGDDDIVVSQLPSTLLDVLFNDAGFADPVTFVVTQPPAHGSLNVSIPNPAWQSRIGVYYTPNAGYTGPDQFQYQLGDGTDTDSATVELVVSADGDSDGLLDYFDNCPATANPGQEDGDGDSVGDACDNCVAIANTGQQDNEHDGLGNACDADDDNDTIADAADNCLYVANTSQYNSDGDLYGNMCDADLNNSGGTVNFTDLALFRAAFGQTNANADLNGSGGIVNFADLSLFRTLFGKPVGPSGLAP